MRKLNYLWLKIALPTPQSAIKENTTSGATEISFTIILKKPNYI
jgi:hypothetical protein